MALNLPIDMKDRRWIVGEECGDVFADETEFDGITLTVEIKSRKEASEIAMAIFGNAAKSELEGQA